MNTADTDQNIALLDKAGFKEMDAHWFCNDDLNVCISMPHGPYFTEKPLGWVAFSAITGGGATRLGEASTLGELFAVILSHSAQPNKQLSHVHTAIAMWDEANTTEWAKHTSFAAQVERINGWAKEFEAIHTDTNWQEMGDYDSVLAKFLSGKLQASELAKDSKHPNVVKDLAKYQQYLDDNNLDDDSETITVTSLLHFVANEIDNDDDQEPRYAYIIDLNERGVFRAHVEDRADNTNVFGFSNEDEDDNGELWIVRDGFMKHIDDVEGLRKYLVSLGIIEDGEQMEREGGLR